jgi:hypothetical protein
MVNTTNPWGRVSDDGTVEVTIEGTWHVVGSYPDGTAEEALALFVRKFDDLEAQANLAEQRMKAGAPAKDLSRALKRLSGELSSATAVGDYEALRARVESLLSAVSELTESQAKEREEAVAAATIEREAIVAEMEALAAKDASSIRWKETSAAVDALFERWKAHQQRGPRLPKTTTDELWKRFKAARNTLDRAKRQHFQERDKATKASKSIKRELIEKAQALAPKGAEGIPAYRGLLEEWKKSPRAARSVEDQLWAQFKAAGDVLYQAKTQQVEAEDEANRENGDAKQKLVHEFSDILSLSDHREAVERLRLFHDRFRQIGPVPRSMVKSIDAEVKKFDQHVKKLEAEHWEKSNPEKQARSQSFLEQIEDQIAQLEQAKAAAEAQGDSAQAKNLEEEISTKVAWKKVLTEAS